jgi:H+/gluconate symporter-like permease
MIAALLGLMFFAYRGCSIILIAPFFAVVAAIGSQHAGLPVYSELYMTRLAEYVKTYYPIFLFGAVFAKLMENGGLASSVAAKIVSVLGEKRAIMAVILGCGALTYGGLSVFVVAFVMYPFGAVIFRQADIPKRLLPATLWIGIFSFAMVALPGTPQIQNIIPAAYFETSTWSGIGIGLFATALFFLMGWGWLTFRMKKLKAAGEGYGSHQDRGQKQSSTHVKWQYAMIPLLMVILLNMFLSNPFNWSWGFHWGENMLDSLQSIRISLMADHIGKVSAIWSISVALILSSIAAAWIGRRRFRMTDGFLKPINFAAISSGTAALNVASGYAFGCVLVAMPGFEPIKNALLGLSETSSPLLSAVLATNIMGGITGSASGGLTIALASFGEQWAQAAIAAGIPLEAMHRIVAIASIGIDPVPHCGALVTLLAICGLTHKQAYFDIVVLLLMKFTVPFLCIAFYMLTGIV